MERSLFLWCDIILFDFKPQLSVSVIALNVLLLSTWKHDITSCVGLSAGQLCLSKLM